MAPRQYLAAQEIATNVVGQGRGKCCWLSSLLMTEHWSESDVRGTKSKRQIGG